MIRIKPDVVQPIIEHQTNCMDCSVTPVSTIVAGYDKCLSDESLVGEALEASAEKLLPIPRPGLQNGHVSARSVTVWDPLFKMLHGEESGLPDAIA